MKFRLLRPNSGDYGEIRIGDLSIFFSYQTVVGVLTSKGEYFRSEIDYSRTTLKHMDALGIKNADKVSAEKLEMMIEEDIKRQVLGD